ncbi:MAG TPA: hypothetical protein VF204_24205 [Streptosporangiaceae bacterium]
MTRSQRLLIVLGLNLALVAGLIAAGAVAGSLAPPPGASPATPR